MAQEEKGLRWLMNTKVQVGFLLIVIFFTFFPQLDQLEPTIMEARNFITAREITQNDTWLIPTMNGYARLAKPPLPTWITALAGLWAGDMDSLQALRVPSSIMAGLTVFFLFLLTRQLTADPLIPFLAALVLASSFLFVNIGRQATWDIYTHSFMLGAIWLLVRGWRKAGDNYLVFALSGILLGCSFLSKGPVSFYALLFPFLLAFGYAFKLQEFRNKQKGVLLALVICLIVSGAWPLYVYLAEPDGLAHNASQETAAWVNRHVKPVWYYWGFPGQVGIWTLFAIASLSIPYARRRISPFGNYKFLFSWVLFTFILLSIIPEKKERYLLPIIIPLALLTAHYLRYLIHAFADRQSGKWDKIVFVSSGVMFSLIAFAIPVLMYFVGYRNQLVSVMQQVIATPLFITLGALILILTFKNRVTIFILVSVVLNFMGLLVTSSLYPHIKHPRTNLSGLPELEEVRKTEQFQTLDFYAVDGMRPENIWEVGKKVDTLKIVNNHLQLPAKLPVVVFSLFPLDNNSLPVNQASLELMHMYQFENNSDAEKYYMYVVTKSNASALTENN